MPNKGRFYGCESLGFPSVFNYDFETNKSIRGVNDRDFRWEDVAVESVYQLKEATTNGSFESTTYVPAYSTGINFLSSGSSSSTAYTGWIVTGSYSLYVGVSGLFVNSGELPGVATAFQAHPLDGDNAIGLYCYTTGNPSAVYSTKIASGQESIVIGGDHQLYYKAKCNYGNTGRIKTYIRGYSSSTIIAYYDFDSGRWTSTEPTGTITIGTGTTETILNFNCSDFPAATPDQYDCYLANIVSGTFITIDDVHVDAYYKKNAYIDYIVPSGYFIQITPDLGWHNILSMFDSNDSTINPHIKTVGPFSTEFGNLVDNLDNSVTATIDASQFTDYTNSNFKKYLWRAVPLTPNGELGAGGLPQRFSYVGDQVNKLFTVNEITEDPTSTTKIIIGTKGATMTVLVDGLPDNPGLTYTSDTTWKLVINLSTVTRIVELQGIDVGGSTSSIRKVTLSSTLYQQNNIALWNIFDEHGLVADIERLPEENNFDYSIRIKDKYKNRTGPNFLGIVNGASNELSINKISDALSISIEKNAYGVAKVNNLTIEVTSYSLRISADSFVTTEKLFVDPIFQTVDLSYLAKDYPIYAEIIDLGKIDIKDFSIITIKEDYLLKNQFFIDNKAALGRYVNITYSYYKEFLYKDYHTLYDLIKAINNFKDSTKEKVINIEISSKLSGSENCLGLYITQKTINPTETLSIGWSPIYLKKVSDRGYRDYFIKDINQTLKNSKYFEYIKELKDGIRIFWGNVESDKDRWDSNVNENLALDSIPTLFDPPLTKIISSLSGEEVRIEAVNAWARNYVGFNFEYLKNVGLTQDLFQPGIGHDNHLAPSIQISTTRIDTASTLESNISDVKNNNNFLLFSGQRS